MADFKSVGSDTLSEVGGTAKTMVKSAAQEVGNVVGGAFGQVTGSMLSPEQKVQEAETKAQQENARVAQLRQLRSQLSSLRGRGTEPQRINLAPRPSGPEVKLSRPQPQRELVHQTADPTTKNQAERAADRSAG